MYSRYRYPFIIVACPTYVGTGIHLRKTVKIRCRFVRHVFLRYRNIQDFSYFLLFFYCKTSSFLWKLILVNLLIRSILYELSFIFRDDISEVEYRQANRRSRGRGGGCEEASGAPPSAPPLPSWRSSNNNFTDSLTPVLQTEASQESSPGFVVFIQPQLVRLINTGSERGIVNVFYEPWLANSQGQASLFLHLSIIQPGKMLRKCQ